MLVSSRPLAPTKITDLVLDTSPQLHHSGSLTRRSEELCSLAPTATLRISPADASRLEIAPGQMVDVKADGRRVSLRARIDKTVPPGTVASIWTGADGSVRDRLESDHSTTAVVVGRTQ